MYRILAGQGNSWIQISELCPGLYCDDNTISAGVASVKWPNIYYLLLIDYYQKVYYSDLGLS